MGGNGFSKIIAKHGIEVIEDVIETLSRGRIVGARFPGTDNERKTIRYKNTLISLALYKDHNRETWLLTGYRKGKDISFDMSKLIDPVFFKSK